MRLEASAGFSEMTAALSQLFGMEDKNSAVSRLLLVSPQSAHLERLRLATAMLACEIHTADVDGEAGVSLRQTGFDLILLDQSLATRFFLKHGPIACPHVLLGTVKEDRDANTHSHPDAVVVLEEDAPAAAWRRTIAALLGKDRPEREHTALRQGLEDSEKLFRYLVQESPDLIFILNAQGEFLFLNERAGDLLGYRRTELIGIHFSAIVHEDDMEKARYVFNEKRARSRTARHAELRLKCASSRRAGRLIKQEKWIAVAFRSVAVYSPAMRPGGPTYCGTYGIGRDVTAHKLAEERLTHQTYYDALTDLPNRLLFMHQADLAFADACRTGGRLAILCLDLDRFKLINDTLGHTQGDLLIQLIAVRLRSALPPEVTLSRLGGDEFMAVLPAAQDRQEAALLACRMLDLLQAPFDLQGNEVHISASIGIALYPDDGSTVEELISRADIATVHVKALGKNGHSFYDGSMLAASHRQVDLVQSLRKALENEELEMYYQPQVDAVSKQIVGVEALLRWHHPERGLLCAGDFLPALEDSGLMLALSDWMVCAVCRDTAAWNRCMITPIRVALNLSPHYLDRGDFGTVLQAALAAFNIPPAQIEVEITEDIGIRDLHHALVQLNALHALGVRIAIDDFGTGYSSLSYLHRFPIHTLKIDKSFIKTIDDAKGNFPIVLAIISIARGLGLHLVAEGVENQAQADYLQQAGCNVMQGYLFHPPLPPRCLPLLCSKLALCA